MIKLVQNRSGNSRLARLGFLAEFKDSFVFGKYVFNRKLNLNLVPQPCQAAGRYRQALKNRTYETTN